jgi:predicted nucleic acid-binding protein
VHDVTPAVARKFGELRAAQFDAATPGPEIDVFNGAIAKVHNLVMATHNTQDYANIPGLTLEDWIVP